jgi:hypothetical protein
MNEETMVVSAEQPPVNPEYKERVMAVLADAPLNKLSNKEMMWAASHLPDHKRKGEFNQKLATNMVFDGNVDHSNSSVYGAFGISEDDLKHYVEVMENEVKEGGKKENSTKSEAIVAILNKLGNDPKFVASLVIKTIGDAQVSSISKRGIDGIIGVASLLEILKKLKKDSEDDE